MPDDRPPPDLGEIETILMHAFSRRKLLGQALTHPSQASAKGAAAFERFEFLGDRVLGLVAADLLISRFPSEREGDLAKRHVQLVRRETLTEIMRLSGLAAALGGADDRRRRSSITADALEAVVGAMYLDGGLDAARPFLTKWLNRFADAAPSPPQDAKTTLQEWSQARGLGLPVYETVGRAGPDHAPEFSVRVTVGGDLSAEGRGGSKRQAEQAAAEALLEDIEARHG